MLNKLYAIINGLENMPRLGAEVDEPEGSRYVQISETLVKQIQSDLTAVAHRLNELEETIEPHD